MAKKLEETVSSLVELLNGAAKTLSETVKQNAEIREIEKNIVDTVKSSERDFWEFTVKRPIVMADGTPLDDYLDSIKAFKKPCKKSSAEKSNCAEKNYLYTDTLFNLINSGFDKKDYDLARRLIGLLYEAIKADRENQSKLDAVSKDKPAVNDPDADLEHDIAVDRFKKVNDDDNTSASAFNLSQAEKAKRDIVEQYERDIKNPSVKIRVEYDDGSVSVKTIEASDQESLNSVILDLLKPHFEKQK